MLRRGHTRLMWASILALVFAMSADSAASAASNCLARPGHYAGPGTHWFYRIDRATQRRCWYLKQVGPAESRVREPERGPAPNAWSTSADSPSNFMSWLSSKVSGVTPSTTEAEKNTAARWAPAPRAETPPPRRTRVASRSERTTSRAERTRAPRTSQQSPAPIARAEAPAPAPAIDPATSEALYREYVQWRVKQLFTPE